MNQKLIKFLVLSIILQFVKIVSCLEKEMTIIVDAGRRECFFEEAEKGKTIDLEYQVIDGGHGDLDISFDLLESNGRVIFSDYKKPDNVHRTTVQNSGIYQFCFDNTFSSFNRKTVFFELLIENEDESDNNVEEFEGLSPGEVYELTISEIFDSIRKVKDHVSKARQIQDMLKSFEAKDRNRAEENYFRVNAWSSFQVLMMIAVGVVQLFLIKSLFDTNQNSKGYKLWHKISEKFK